MMRRRGGLELIVNSPRMWFFEAIVIASCISSSGCRALRLHIELRRSCSITLALRAAAEHHFNIIPNAPMRLIHDRFA